MRGSSQRSSGCGGPYSSSPGFTRRTGRNGSRSWPSPWRARWPSGYWRAWQRCSSTGSTRSPGSTSSYSPSSPRHCWCSSAWGRTPCFARGRRAGRNLRRVLIVGAGRAGRRLAEAFRQYPWMGVEVVGFLDDRATAPGVLGATDETAVVLDRMALEGRVVDFVYIALPSWASEKIEGISGRGLEAARTRLPRPGPLPVRHDPEQPGLGGRGAPGDPPRGRGPARRAAVLQARARHRVLARGHPHGRPPPPGTGARA
jgi:hypothetical protein